MDPQRTPRWWLTRVELAIAALAGAVVGSTLMIRIMRAPGDEPPAWRDRDR